MLPYWTTWLSSQTYDKDINTLHSTSRNKKVFFLKKTGIFNKYQQMIWINFLPFRWQSNYDDDDDDDGQGKKTSRRQISVSVQYSVFSFHFIYKSLKKFLAFIKHSNQYSIMIIILLFFGFFKKQQRKNQWHNLTSTSFGLIFGFPQICSCHSVLFFCLFGWWIFHQLLINCQKKKNERKWKCLQICYADCEIKVISEWCKFIIFFVCHW